MYSRLITPMVAVWALVLVPLVGCFAQESGGRILGTVSDTSGALVPSARVMAKSPTLPGHLETSTNGSGWFALQNVPAGTYEVTIERQGFATTRQLSVEVNLGSAIEIHPILTVGAVTSTVEVSEREDVLETGSSGQPPSSPAASSIIFPKGEHSILCC